MRKRTTTIIIIVIISCDPKMTLTRYLLCYPDFSKAECKSHCKQVGEPGSTPVGVLDFSVLQILQA